MTVARKSSKLSKSGAPAGREMLDSARERLQGWAGVAAQLKDKRPCPSEAREAPVRGRRSHRPGRGNLAHPSPVGYDQPHSGMRGRPRS
jgi:hypothetical protein